MFLVLHESVFSVPIMSWTVCVTVSRGNKILTDGLLVNVISTSSLRELLENTDLVLADDDTVVVKCATTENDKQYDADLSNTVEQLLEFGRKYISQKNPTDRPPAGDPKKPGTDNFYRVALL